MPTPDLTLYHCPGACSQVSLFALEAAGLEYRLELVDLKRNAQTTPTYLGLSPLGKVPLLVIDGHPLTEQVAILTYVSQLRPQAGLLPSAGTPLASARSNEGLAYCSGTLHPIVRGIVNPARLTTGDVEGVRERAMLLAVKAFGHADRRIGAEGWWLEQPSVVDVYLHWAFMTAVKGGLYGSSFPFLQALTRRLQDRPGFKNMLELETASQRALECSLP